MSMTLLRTAATVFSPAGIHSRLSIFIYHRVLPEPDPLSDSDPVAEAFDWQMELIARQFNVLPLEQAIARLQAGSLPSRAACITFDDGFADNLYVALPTLNKQGLHATFFVSTGYLGGGIMFNDLLVAALRDSQRDKVNLSFVSPDLPRQGERLLGDAASRRAVFYELLGHIRYRPVEERLRLAHQVAEECEVAAPTDLMLDEAGVKALYNAGMGIGAHTVSHPILAQCDEQQARDEILLGKQRLEAIIDAPVALFAYPNGRPGDDYGRREMELVREAGYIAAVSTIDGAAHASALNTGTEDLMFQLPRFTPWDDSPGRFMVRSVRNYFTDYKSRLI